MAQARQNKTERQAAVAAALEQGGPLSFTQRRALARQFACSPVTIYDDMNGILKLSSVASPPAVLQLTAPGALAADRDVAILRFLGRVEFATTKMIKVLLGPDITRPTMLSYLNRLHQEGRIWQQKISMDDITPLGASGKGHPPPKMPLLWGLTPEGRDLLELLGVESSPQIYAALRPRDRRAPKVAKLTLRHDMLVSQWCASFVDGARRFRLLDSITCQVEYISARYPDGREHQRMDAFLALTFNREPKERTEPLWKLPWNNGENPTPQQIIVRYALEVDRGTEQLKTLLAKAYTYRELTERGHYRQTLGGEVLPVVLVPPGLRAGQISREWQHAWPGGRGVISNFLKASHPRHGTLWGEYYSMTDKPEKDKSLPPTHLLAGVIPDLATWERFTL